MQVLRAAYFVLVHCHLEYALLAWGHMSTCDRLFKSQRRAIRVVANLAYREDCRSYFRSLGILTVPSMLIFKCLEYRYKRQARIVSQIKLVPQLQH